MAARSQTRKLTNDPREKSMSPPAEEDTEPRPNGLERTSSAGFFGQAFHSFENTLRGSAPAKRPPPLVHRSRSLEFDGNATKKTSPGDPCTSDAEKMPVEARGPELRQRPSTDEGPSIVAIRRASYSKARRNLQEQLPLEGADRARQLFGAMVNGTREAFREQSVLSSWIGQIKRHLSELDDEEEKEQEIPDVNEDEDELEDAVDMLSCLFSDLEVLGEHNEELQVMVEDIVEACKNVEEEFSKLRRLSKIQLDGLDEVKDRIEESIRLADMRLARFEQRIGTTRDYLRNVAPAYGRAKKEGSVISTGRHSDCGAEDGAFTKIDSIRSGASTRSKRRSGRRSTGKKTTRVLKAEFANEVTLDWLEKDLCTRPISLMYTMCRGITQWMKAIDMPSPGFMSRVENLKADLERDINDGDSISNEIIGDEADDAVLPVSTPDSLPELPQQRPASAPFQHSQAKLPAAAVRSLRSRSPRSDAKDEVTTSPAQDWRWEAVASTVTSPANDGSPLECRGYSLSPKRGESSPISIHSPSSNALSPSQAASASQRGKLARILASPRTTPSPLQTVSPSRPNYGNVLSSTSSASNHPVLFARSHDAATPLLDADSAAQVPLGRAHPNPVSVAQHISIAKSISVAMAPEPPVVQPHDHCIPTSSTDFIEDSDSLPKPAVTIVDRAVRAKPLQFDAEQFQAGTSTSSSPPKLETHADSLTVGGRGMNAVQECGVGPNAVHMAAEPHRATDAAASMPSPNGMIASDSSPHGATDGAASMPSPSGMIASNSSPHRATDGAASMHPPSGMIASISSAPNRPTSETQEAPHIASEERVTQDMYAGNLRHAAKQTRYTADHFILPEVDAQPDGARGTHKTMLSPMKPSNTKSAPNIALPSLTEGNGWHAVPGRAKNGLLSPVSRTTRQNGHAPHFSPSSLTRKTRQQKVLGESLSLPQLARNHPSPQKDRALCTIEAVRSERRRRDELLSKPSMAPLPPVLNLPTKTWQRTPQRPSRPFDGEALLKVGSMSRTCNIAALDENDCGGPQMDNVLAAGAACRTRVHSKPLVTLNMRSGRVRLGRTYQAGSHTASRELQPLQGIGVS